MTTDTAVVADAPGVPAMPAALPIDPAQFQALLAYIRPQPDELRWQRIPWQTDLWAARRLAVKHRRPIFLWAMNGNPLGCT